MSLRGGVPDRGSPARPGEAARSPALSPGTVPGLSNGSAAPSPTGHPGSTVVPSDGVRVGPGARLGAAARQCRCHGGRRRPCRAHPAVRYDHGRRTENVGTLEESGFHSAASVNSAAPGFSYRTVLHWILSLQLYWYDFELTDLSSQYSFTEKAS